MRKVIFYSSSIFTQLNLTKITQSEHIGPVITSLFLIQTRRDLVDIGDLMELTTCGLKYTHTNATRGQITSSFTFPAEHVQLCVHMRKQLLSFKKILSVLNACLRLLIVKKIKSRNFLLLKICKINTQKPSKMLRNTNRNHLSQNQRRQLLSKKHQLQLLNNLMMHLQMTF